MRKIIGQTFTLIAVSLVLSLPVYAVSEDFTTYIFDKDARWLGHEPSKNTVKVYIIDQVKEGCWTSIKASENAVKLELQRSGFTVLDENDESSVVGMQVLMDALGYRAPQGICVVRYDLTVRALDNAVGYGWGGENADIPFRVSSMLYSQIWNSGGVVSGGDVNTLVKESFIEVTQEFLLAAPKKRKEVIEATIENATDETAKTFWTNLRQ
jgi:hypothetical protein